MSETAKDTQPEVQDNPYYDMINHALSQDFNKANEIFGDVMTVKMSDLMDQEKIKLAGQIYNGEEPDEEEEDDSQLELDLEAEGDEEEDQDDEVQEPDSLQSEPEAE